ncbi:hypothetical protein D5F01_LYC24093 [Larimichthys crocea]|uniref:Uncharacterized protein n=1 Tax=Larimichthys crocea TaxID=215358 RepID=A0A6G0HF55_LARCR|nr:hypothetical protein D5F01_LYC24093 [Larimichthys crocea]
MPRKGKRSRAQKLRWTAVNLADPAPLSPTTSDHWAQMVPQTPPSTSQLWKMENAPTPTNSPAYKVLKIQTPPQSKYRWMTSEERGLDAPTCPRSPAEKALSTDVTHAILIVTPECIAVFSDRSGRYGVFDSHSRNARGLPYPDGTAIMLTFGHLSDLINHLHKLFNERGTHATYEFVPISFHSVDNPIECHGQPDDVEKILLLYTHQKFVSRKHLQRATWRYLN